MSMIYSCCDDPRRDAVLAHPTLNGIDFLEVSDDPADPYWKRQTILRVHFLKPVVAGSLSMSNISIRGGERIQDIKVVSVTGGGMGSPPAADPPPLIVEVSIAGDFSTYTLALVTDAETPAPPAGYDPVLASIDFSFKVMCAGDFDCQPAADCAAPAADAVSINYLARDYAGFRQLMLDRMLLVAPGWKERNAADPGIALVEVLAYVGDYLSYQQDAIATEAYLGTARRRVSVRRHARLVDYLMHDGCNARGWAHIEVGPGVAGLSLKRNDGTVINRLLTKTGVLPDKHFMRIADPVYQQAVDGGSLVFELLHDLALYSEHNQIYFYTWGALECCLPKGSTRATLSGGYPFLRAGQVLVFAEVMGPRTGVAEDADPAHRCAVRLTKVGLSSDPLYDQAVTEIEWHVDDALPFPLCISARADTSYYPQVSVAMGNIVLVDEGLSVSDDGESSLVPSAAPNSGPAAVVPTCCDPCNTAPVQPVPARFYPRLNGGPLTFAAPYDATDTSASASAAFIWSMRDVAPVIALRQVAAGGQADGNIDWVPVRDLFGSHGSDLHFVVEMESDGTAYIRFGDNKQGSRPPQGVPLLASYRVGNGTAGNIGAGALAHLASNDPNIIAIGGGITGIWNPMPARGAVDKESLQQVRQLAPNAYRRQERAVIPADYEEMAKRVDPGIQRAACTMRWTGSWRTAFLTVDRLGGAALDAAYERDLRDKMERYRMAGVDLEADGPLYVALEIEMTVCVKINYTTGDVRAALLKVFSNSMLADGRPGVFHPDNFSFGTPVYLSRLYAAAQETEGVDSVRITTFRRQGDPGSDAIDTGKLLLGRLEIARLDNDPNFPERGVFSLVMLGGKRNN